ncbi:hypothetical protein Tsubulata_003811, partial [Turnera subulata]
MAGKERLASSQAQWVGHLLAIPQNFSKMDLTSWEARKQGMEINYEPSLTFNPWRWLEEAGYAQEKNWELLKLVCSFTILSHNTGGWEEVGEIKLLKFPRVEAQNGFHIR